MDTLPIEVIKLCVMHYRDCVALRRTCKRFADFTMTLDVHWESDRPSVINENFDEELVVLFAFLVTGKVRTAQTSSDNLMRTYLLFSHYAGYEYILWFCSVLRDKIDRVLDGMPPVYTYHIVTGTKTAVYIKTADLVRQMYVPGGYHDLLW